MSLCFFCAECGYRIISGYLKSGDKCVCPNCGDSTEIPENAQECDEKSNIIGKKADAGDKVIQDTVGDMSAVVDGGRARRFSYLDLLWIYLISFLFQVIGGFIIGFFFTMKGLDFSAKSPWFVLFSNMLSGFSTLCAMKIFTDSRFGSEKFKDMLMLKHISVKDCYSVTLIGIAAGVVINLIARNIQTAETFFDRLVKDSGNSGFIVFVLIALIAPFFEELILRGFLFSFFSEKKSEKAALIITTIWFGILHIGGYGLNNPVLLAITFMGFIFGYMRYKYQSVIPAIVCHFAYNITIVFLVYQTL